MVKTFCCFPSFCLYVIQISDSHSLTSNNQNFLFNLEVIVPQSKKYLNKRIRSDPHLYSCGFVLTRSFRGGIRPEGMFTWKSAARKQRFEPPACEWKDEFVKMFPVLFCLQTPCGKSPVTLQQAANAWQQGGKSCFVIAWQSNRLIFLAHVFLVCTSASQDALNHSLWVSGLCFLAWVTKCKVIRHVRGIFSAAAMESDGRKSTV